MIEYIVWFEVGMVALIITSIVFIRYRWYGSAGHPLDVLVGSVVNTYGISVPPRMTADEEKRFHMFRLFFDGSNRYGDSWSVNPENSPHAIIDAMRWKIFAHRELAPVFDCTVDTKWYIHILAVLYPPICELHKYWLRLKRASLVCRLIATKGSSVWADPEARAVGAKYALRFGCDAQSASVGWIDVLDFHKNESVGNVCVSRYSGLGSYLYPYCTDGNDMLKKGIRSTCPVMLRSTPRRTGSSYMGSYTTLRDALVEVVDASRGSMSDYCYVRSVNGDPYPDPSPGSRYVVTTRVTPLCSTECIREEAIDRDISQERQISFLATAHRILFEDMYPEHVTPPKYSLIILLALLFTGISALHVLALDSVFQINWGYLVAATQIPPLSFEFACSIFLLMLFQADSSWGRWVVSFLLCSIPVDLVISFFDWRAGVSAMLKLVSVLVLNTYIHRFEFRSQLV
jgi:hypothetical protein